MYRFPVKANKAWTKAEWLEYKSNVKSFANGFREASDEAISIMMERED